jgi:hydrogenase maturation protease
VSVRVLVAGIGNVFLSDDGFGPEAVRRLERDGGLPGDVRVADYGIRGLHLAYDLLDPVDALILLDTVSAGDRPGEITVLQVGPALEVGPADLGDGATDPHGMDPAAMLAGLHRMGGTLPSTYVVGCRPATLTEGLGLSPYVEAAVPAAIAAVRALVARLVPAGRR